MDGYIGTLCTYVFDIYCQPKGASIMTLTRDNLFSNMDSLVKKPYSIFGVHGLDKLISSISIKHTIKEIVEL